MSKRVSDLGPSDPGHGPQGISLHYQVLTKHPFSVSRAEHACLYEVSSEIPVLIHPPFFFFFKKTESCFFTQSGLELLTCLPQPFECQVH